MDCNVIICCKDNIEYDNYLRICLKKTISLKEFDIQYFAASEDIFVIRGSFKTDCYKTISETVIKALECKNYIIYFSIHPGRGSESSIKEQINDLNIEASEDDNKVIFSYHGSYNQEFNFSEDLDQILEPLISYSDRITKDNKSQKEFNESVFKFLQSLKNKDYYECLNPKIYFFDGQKLNSLEADNCNPFKLHILIVTESLIKTSGVLQKIAKYFGDYDKVNTIPMLTIGNFALNKAFKKDNDDKVLETYLPKNFLDSSIWNYYININKEKDLEKVLEIIYENHKKGLYHSVVSQEFIEFNYRRLHNSFIKKPQGVEGSGHSEHISPFMFHSEYQMKKKTENLINKTIIGKHLKKNPGHEILWKVLMVDDYANIKLTSLDAEKELKTKKEIFLHVIHKFTKQLQVEFDFKSEFQAKKVLGKKVIEDIKNTQYDLILLDYLLDRKKDDNGNRYYGDELIDKGILKKAKGVLGKSWIFPISSFNTAMHSKLRDRGINKLDDYWYISDGADIVNTPKLFAYYFFKLIELQLNQAIVTKEKIIKEVFDDVDWDIEKVRPTARMQYGAYMHKFGLREFLKNDIENKSAFATSIMQLNDTKYHDDYLLYEDTRKLLYLLGFSTKHQKNELWETFTRVKNKVEENSSLTIISKYINEI